MKEWELVKSIMKKAVRENENYSSRNYPKLAHKEVTERMKSFWGGWTRTHTTKSMYDEKLRKYKTMTEIRQWNK